MNKSVILISVILLSVFIISFVSADSLTIPLNQGNITAVSVGGNSYTLILSSVSSNAANITVNGILGTINVGSIATIAGVNIHITSISSSLGNTLASVILTISNISSSNTAIICGTGYTSCPYYTSPTFPGYYCYAGNVCPPSTGLSNATMGQSFNISLISLAPQILFYVNGSPASPYSMEYTELRFVFKNIGNPIPTSNLLANPPVFSVGSSLYNISGQPAPGYYFIPQGNATYDPEPGYWSPYSENYLAQNESAIFTVYGYFQNNGTTSIQVAFENNTFTNQTNILYYTGCYSSNNGDAYIPGWTIGQVSCVNQSACVTQSRSQDICQDSNTLLEYICSPDRSTSGGVIRKYVNSINCPNGCLNGACIFGNGMGTVSCNSGQVLCTSPSTNISYCAPTCPYTSSPNMTSSNCTSNWQCGDWSDCGAFIQGDQTQNCTDLNGCLPDNITSVKPCGSSNVSIPVNVNGTSICTSGCLYQNTCLPYGYRIGSSYCNIDNTLTDQTSNGSCDNNFECTSNLCANSECIAPNFLQQIINFFRNLFGIQ